MRKLIVIALSSFLITGCVAHHRAGEIHPAHGLGVALGYLVLSPLFIIAGLLEGIATAPYFAHADIHDMNREMERADTGVTLDQTYQHAYGRRLETVPKSGSTGKVFHNMREATRHFQNVLMGYGVVDHERYLLTAVSSADRAGYTLFSLVYREARRISIIDQSGLTRTLSPADRDFYEAYKHDASGRPLDVVIDWGGVPRRTIRTQKEQAILLTLATNSVLINRRRDDYWEAARRWRAGEYEAVVAERKRDLDLRMRQSS